MSDCTDCYEPVDGTAIHDDGTTWHPECRRARSARLARAKAAAYLRQDVDLARVLADIQRGHLQAA